MVEAEAAGSETIAGSQKPGDRRGRKRENDQWTAQFEAQMLVCGLLAKALFGDPDRAWLSDIVSSRLFRSSPLGTPEDRIAAACKLLDEWTQSISEQLNDTTFERLQADHMLLFVGPGKLMAPPWQSVYAGGERAIFQREAASVRNWYRRFELDLASDFNQPADHVGLQFSFLARLAQSTLHAGRREDAREVKRLIDAQRAFLRLHMLNWVPLWAADVERHASTPYYRGIALLACGMLDEAKSFFAIDEIKASAGGSFQREKSGRAN